MADAPVAVPIPTEQRVAPSPNAVDACSSDNDNVDDDDARLVEGGEGYQTIALSDVCAKLDRIGVDLSEAIFDLGRVHGAQLNTLKRKLAEKDAEIITLKRRLAEVEKPDSEFSREELRQVYNNIRRNEWFRRKYGVRL